MLGQVARAKACLAELRERGFRVYEENGLVVKPRDRLDSRQVETIKSLRFAILMLVREELVKEDTFKASPVRGARLPELPGVGDKCEPPLFREGTVRTVLVLDVLGHTVAVDEERHKELLAVLAEYEAVVQAKAKDEAAPVKAVKVKNQSPTLFGGEK